MGFARYRRRPDELHLSKSCILYVCKCSIADRTAAPDLKRREMTQSTTFTIATLHLRVEAIFLKAGLNAVQAGAVARAIVAGAREACKSHGVHRLEGALRTVTAGELEPGGAAGVDVHEGAAVVAGP